MAAVQYKYKLLTFLKTPGKQNKFVKYNFYNQDSTLAQSIEDKFYDPNTTKMEVWKQQYGRWEISMTIRVPDSLVPTVYGISAKNLKETVSLEELENVETALVQLKDRLHTLDHAYDTTQIEEDLTKLKKLKEKLSEQN